MTTPRLCALVFVMCAAPRAAVLLRTPAPKPNYYWEIATSLLTSGTYAMGSGVTTAIEPLYPFLLAAVRFLTGDRFALAMLMQIVIASCGGILLLLLTQRLTGSRTAAVSAAVLYAFYPYYVRQSIAPHELTLSIVLLVTAAWMYSRTENIRQAALFGASLGLLLLLRFAFAPLWIGGTALVAVRRSLQEAAIVAFVPLLLLAPWVLRTRAVDGSTIPTRAGQNLFLASCEFAEQVLPFYDIDLMVDYSYDAVDADRLMETTPVHLVERRIDQAMMTRALECIRADPMRALRLKVRNLLYVFAPLLLPAHARIDDAEVIVEDGRLRFVHIYPRPSFDRISHAIAHTVLLIGAALGLFARRRVLREDAFLLVIVTSIAAVYALFFPTTRLTAPMAVVLMFYAGAAVEWVTRRPSPDGSPMSEVRSPKSEVRSENPDPRPSA